jgi:TolA-binding protein
MKMATGAKTKEDQTTAYNALNDYSSLDPKFAAQTRQTVLELAYSLNVIPRPASAKAIAESNDLVQQADLLQQQGTPESYQSALKVLTEALNKNRNNRKADELITVVQAKIQSTAVSVLSPRDAQRYKQALGLYLSGAYQEAYDIIRSLWDSSPTNSKYPDLIRLRKRCEVALNIS